MKGKIPKSYADADSRLLFRCSFGVECGGIGRIAPSLYERGKGASLYKAVPGVKPGAALILTDYFASSAEEEQMHRAELLRLKAQQGVRDNEFCHYDAPLTVQHEIDALLTAGLSSAEVLKQWGTTCTIKAAKGS